METTCRISAEQVSLAGLDIREGVEILFSVEGSTERGFRLGIKICEKFFSFGKGFSFNVPYPEEVHQQEMELWRSGKICPLDVIIGQVGVALFFRISGNLEISHKGRRILLTLKLGSYEDTIKCSRKEVAAFLKGSG